MFEILFLIVVSVYFIQAVVLSIGSKKKFSKIKHNELLTATVIVAARNEEKNIERCLESLDKLEYPEGKLEIILVDDFSEDRTEEIIKEFIKDKPKFALIKPEKKFGDTRGKARAIANAIELAKGEIILTTDADCAVSPTWAKTLASYYEEDVIMVCGYTNQTHNNLFEAVQDVDFIYLLTAGAGSINLGKPLSAIGNNMSYRKSAYLEVGGYEKIPFSVTEDFQLLMAINKLKDKKIIYPADAESLVTSKTCEDVKTLIRQKRRWAIGGLESRIDNLLLILTGVWSALFIWLIPFFYSANVLYLLLLKVFADLFMVYFIYKKLKLKFNLFHFLAFQVYSAIYFFVVGVSIIFNKKIYWKGRQF